MSVINDLAQKLKKLREEERLTQLDVATMMHVSRKTISGWENERSIPDAGSLVKLSEIYHVPVDDLIRDDRLLKHYEEQDKRDKSTSRFLKFSYWIEVVLWILGYAEILKVAGFHVLLVPLLMLINSVILLANFTDWERFKSKKYLTAAVVGIAILFVIHVVLALIDPGDPTAHSARAISSYLMGRATLIILVTVTAATAIFFHPFEKRN